MDPIFKSYFEVFKRDVPPQHQNAGFLCENLQEELTRNRNETEYFSSKINVDEHLGNSP